MKEGWERDAGEQLYAPEGDVSHAEVADGGEILGRCIDPLSSASGTLETVESRPGTNPTLAGELPK